MRYRYIGEGELAKIFKKKKIKIKIVEDFYNNEKVMNVVTDNGYLQLHTDLNEILSNWETCQIKL